ncbi:hypothetical protein T06_1171 [Trichinella sp. T6]|nr:hypothetical protein T06_1171 [Trichinella sp. T6]
MLQYPHFGKSGSSDEDRKHYTDGVASVLAALLRPNCDGRNPPAPTNRRKRLPPPARKRSERKRSNYASFQSLFRRDPKRIAAHLIKNQPLCNVSCPIDVAESALRQRLSQRPSHRNAHPALKTFCPPYQQTSPYHAAPQTYVYKNVALYCFLLARDIPPQLKNCRTTYIPKTDNPRPDAEDYRPITIASCIYRQFSEIVTRRLENSVTIELDGESCVDQHGNRRSWTELDGTRPRADVDQPHGKKAALRMEIHNRALSEQHKSGEDD